MKFRQSFVCRQSFFRSMAILCAQFLSDVYVALLNDDQVGELNVSVYVPE